MREVPITLTCPDCGAEWPTGSVKAMQETRPPQLSRKHITFHMPCDHFPSLAKMVRTGQFSVQEADDMLARAQRTADGMREVEPT